MGLINRNTDYAIRAVCFMAKDKKKVICVGELVKHLKIPRPFLRKILQTLNKKRILKSYKGKSGGFILARLPNKIFIMDLIRIFQGGFKLRECLFKKRRCPNLKSCPLSKKLAEIEKYVISELGGFSIASLAGEIK